MRSYWRLGLNVALTTFVPLGLGLWLDHTYGTTPLFVLIGAIFGIVASTVGIVRFASRAIKTLANTPETTSDNVDSTS